MPTIPTNKLELETLKHKNQVMNNLENILGYHYGLTRSQIISRYGNKVLLNVEIASYLNSFLIDGLLIEKNLNDVKGTLIKFSQSWFIFHRSLKHCVIEGDKIIKSNNFNYAEKKY